MSDSTGPAIKPGTPTFSSPEGYASTTLTVTSSDGKSQIVPQTQASYPAKGYTPGTFVTKIKSPFPMPLKVGTEIQNPAKKDLVDFAKAVREAGIEPIHDEKGNIISVTLPDGYISEEEHTQKLAQATAIKEGDMRVLKELLPIHADFSSLEERSLLLKAALRNPSTLASLEKLGEEIKALTGDITENPTYARLDKLKTKLEEFKITLSRAQGEVAKQTSIQPPSPVIAPTAPVSAPANPAFTSGNIITLSRPEGAEKYRVFGTKDGIVTLASLDHREKGKETFSEEELKKLVLPENKKEKGERFSYLPIQDFFTMFNNKTNYDINGLLAWKKKWVDSGEIDKFRAKNGNIQISGELIQDAKRAVAIYTEALQTGGITRELYDSAISNLALNVRLLTGVQDQKQNDIEFTVKHKILNGASLDAVKAAIEKIKQGKNPSNTQHQASNKEQALPSSTDIYRTWNVRNLEDKQRINGAIKIFEEYKKFMLEVEQAKKIGLFITLVDQKKEIESVLDSGDKQFAATLIQRFSSTLNEKKGEWEKYLKGQEGVVEQQKKKEAVLQAFEEKKKQLREIEGWVQELIQARISPDTSAFFERLSSATKGMEVRLSNMLQGNDAFDERLLEDFNARMENLRTQVALTHENLNLVHSSGPNNPVERGSSNPILRPIIARKGTEAQPIRLAKRAANGSMRENDERNSTVEGLKQDEDARLAVEASEKAMRENLGRAETVNKFEEMFNKNRKGFIELYTDKRQDPDTNEYFYTKNEKLLKHPYRDVIESVLFKNNVPVEDPLGEELRWDAELKKKKDLLAQAGGSLQSGKLVYSPAQEKKQWPQDVRTEQEKLERQTIDLPDDKDNTNKEFFGLPQTSGLVSQAQQVSSPAQAEYLDTQPVAAPQVGAPASQPQSEPTQEKERGMQKALKKVNDLLFARENFMTQHGTPTLRMFLAVLALTGGGLTAYFAKAPSSPESAKPTISAAQPKSNLAEDPRLTWIKYFTAGKNNPQLAKDLSTLATYSSSTSYNKQGEFMKKNAPLFFKISGSTSAALGLMGNIIRNGPEENASDPYSHLPENTRLELTKLWEALNDASMATSAEKLKASTYGEALTEVAQKIAKKQNT